MDSLSAYIQKARSTGATDPEIQKELVSSGWDEEKVTAALHGSGTTLPVPPPPGPNRVNDNQSIHQASSTWVTFEHILMFISLYVLAVSLGLLMHFLADKWLPGVRGALSYAYATDFGHTLLRGYLAAAIVSLPMFSSFFLSISKQTLLVPALRQIHTRKTLIYGTLVVTFIIMLVNVIGTVYAFLNGNVTLNSLVHIGITLFVSGSIFGYYLSQVKEDRRTHA